jgi:hypothetical protein
MTNTDNPSLFGEPPDASCAQCARYFQPRRHGGGEPQRFCSSACRSTYHRRGAANHQEMTASVTSTVGATATVANGGGAQTTAIKRHEKTREKSRWRVEPQAEIRCDALIDGSVEVTEVSPMGEDKDVRILVNRTNTVRLAAMILAAAGFENIVIAVTDGDARWDLHDGDTPDAYGY